MLYDNYETVNWLEYFATSDRNCKSKAVMAIFPGTSLG